MNRLKVYKSIVWTGCALAVCAVATGALADGDPTEVAAAEDILDAAMQLNNETDGLRPDEQAAVSEDAVATVTADGDFLLPTYLLPGETADVERTTTVEEVYEPVAVPNTTVTTVVRETVKTSENVIMPPEKPAPAVVAEPAPQVVKPQVPVWEVPVTQKKIVAQEDELEELLKATVPAVVPPDPVEPSRKSVRRSDVVRLGSGNRAGARVAQQVQPPKKILIPLAALPEAAEVEPTIPTKERFVAPSEYADQMSDSLRAGTDMPFLMPHEIRITFYPHASAFSGQALKWVKAFALAALKDPRLVVEVRASCAEADLQKTRLALVKDTLRGAGLSTHQIIVNYTNRPVDTMLLRAVPRAEAEEIVVTQKDKKLPKNMSQVKKW